MKNQPEQLIGKMFSFKRYPVIVLDRTAVEDYVRASRNHSAKVGSTFTEIVFKRKFGSGTPAERNIKHKTEVILQRVKHECDTPVSSEGVSYPSKKPYLADVVGKVKREKEEPKEVTHELVRYVSNCSPCKIEKLLLLIEQENTKNKNQYGDECSINFDNTPPISWQEVTLELNQRNVHHNFSNTLHGIEMENSSKTSGRTTISNSKIVCPMLSEGAIKKEFVSGEPANRALKDEKEVTTPLQDDLRDCKMKNIIHSLVVKLEKEDADECRITHNSVEHFDRDSNCEKLKNNENEYCHRDEIDFCIADALPHISACDESTVKVKRETVLNKRVTQSDKYYDSSKFKLVTVSVRLEDLFPGSLRRLGEAHSNKTSCACVYCRGEFRCSSNKALKNLECGKFQRSIPEAKRTESTSRKVSGCKRRAKLKQSRASLLVYYRALRAEHQYECNECTKTFSGRKTFRIHWRVAHSGEKPFKCNLCPRAFAQPKTLNYHLKLHSSERPFACNICPAKFKSKVYLEAHLKVHSGKKPYKCKMCPKAFGKNCGLSIHLSTAHSNERPFECNLCPAKFKIRAALSGHLRCVHRNVRPKQCKVCSKTFTSKSCLVAHVQSHTNKRNFSCEQCPLKFKRLAYLKQHLPSHSNEKQFKCKLCPLAFKTQGRAYYHSQTRHSDKVFECALCLAKFQQKIKLYTHLKVRCDDRSFKCKLCRARFNQLCLLNRHEASHSNV